ncbi:hypothetical protein DFH94DRAFT_354451 [Russula ochroleuca]|uniref:Uncharacterized protein n=1 Tax=Russula ochroleuca TaxID=152965 RepID=A0A9P5MQA4_9AGAM|nr:hypothetical protein DFH94DRAFT_354451 [Russula ochroleuca]
MYRQHPPPPPPPPTFPEPFPKSRPANRSQNAAGADTTYLQTGRPPGNTHDPRVPSPSAHSSLPQSSVQPPPRGQPPPILRSTYPGSNIPPHEPPPPYEYALHPPAPQPSSGSDSHHPPFPIPFITPRKPTTNSSGPQQPVFQHSTATPIFDHPISSEPLSYRACVHQQGDFSSNDKRPRGLFGIIMAFMARSSLKPNIASP